MLQYASLCVIYLAGFGLEILIYGNQLSAIAAMLCGIILGCLSLTYLDSAHSIWNYTSALFCLFSIFIPVLQPFLGVALLVMPGTGLYFTCSLAAISLCTFAIQQEIRNTVELLFLLLFAGILNGLIRILKNAQEQMIALRDDAKEKQLIVEEKNKVLRENQDNNIYLATLQERNRIAREIHDNVGHMLTRSILQTGAIKTVNQDERLAPLLEGLHDTLNTAMTNIRESVHDLHDESVDLQASLREILATAADFETVLGVDVDGMVPKKIKYGFIAIVKEAVNNAVKHSNGSQISVQVREHPGFYQLLIEDNGKNAGVQSENGIGLGNIRDRVKELGGTVTISGGNGFRIFVSIIK